MQIGANVFAKNDLEQPSARSVLPPLLTPERNLAVGLGAQAGSHPPPRCKYFLTFTHFRSHICSLFINVRKTNKPSENTGGIKKKVKNHS